MRHVNNIGKKLKGLAVFCTVAGCIGSIILGIAIGSAIWNGWIGVGIVIVGFLISWLSSLLMYGVGELNDSDGSYYEKTTAEKLHNLEKQITELQKAVVSSSAAVQAVKNTVQEIHTASEPVPEGMWRCEHCGSLNSEDDAKSSCKYCGKER